MSPSLQDAFTLAADLHDMEIIADLHDMEIIDADPLEREIWQVCEALKVATDSFEQRVLYRNVQALHDRRTAEMVQRIQRVRGVR